MIRRVARLGRREEAIEAYRRALELVSIEPERRFLEGKLAQAQRQADVASPRGEPAPPGRS